MFNISDSVKKRWLKITGIVGICAMLFTLLILFVPGLNHMTYHILVNAYTSDKVASIQKEEVLINSDIILDTRTKQEYEVSHLPNAIWVGEEFELEDTVYFEPNKRIVVYCSIGWRSENYALNILAHQNVEVKNLYGGIIEWSNNKGDLIDQQGNTTNKTHPYSWFWGLWITEGETGYN